MTLENFLAAVAITLLLGMVLFAYWQLRKPMRNNCSFPKIKNKNPQQRQSQSEPSPAQRQKKDLLRRSVEHMACRVWQQSKQFAAKHLPFTGSPRDIQAAATLVLMADVLVQAEVETGQATQHKRHRALRQLVDRCNHNLVTAAAKRALEKFGDRVILQPLPGHAPGMVTINTLCYKVSMAADVRTIEPHQSNHQAQGFGNQLLSPRFFNSLVREGWHQTSGRKPIFRRLRPLLKFTGTSAQWSTLLPSALTGWPVLKR